MDVINERNTYKSYIIRVSPIYPEEKFLRIFHFDQNEVEIIPKNGM